MPDRELGGYANSNALGTGPGISIREIDLIISPAISTVGSTTEQTFTLPGALASDRCVAVTTTTGQPESATTSLAVVLAAGSRVSAISIISIPFTSFATAAGTPTTSITYAVFLASQRAIP